MPGCRRNVVASLPSCSADMASQRISIFPLAGALLFPRMHLPLHIFEPRYRVLISDSMARDRRIGMIQPRDRGLTPAIYDSGFLGRISKEDPTTERQSLMRTSDAVVCLE